MITNEFLRMSLIQSKKWCALVENLDIMKMASAGTIDFKKMTAADKEEIILWLTNDVEEPPKILSEYVERCK